MTNKFMERIRNILISIILPIREKKETLLNNFRLSIVFRISLSYMRLLFTHGIIFMLGFAILYIYTEKNSYDQLSNNLIKKIDIEAEPILDNIYADQGLTLSIKEVASKRELYNDIGYKGESERDFYYGIHYDRKSKSNTLVINQTKKVTIDGRDYEILFQYDMTYHYLNMFSMLWKLVIIYVILVLLIIKKGQERDVKLFEPLRIMSATANRLTVNNLHSERLNIEGTKNELKDLANVINSMLDRIETSYESQKQFVSDASHELRTPIAVIQGYANLLNRWGKTNPEVMDESIEAIQNEARAMQDLVEKLLFLSRHDKKTFKLNKRKFNMRPLVEDMIKETRLVAENRIINSPILEDVIVYGDKQSLKQAIRIFIDNAVKYSNDGDTITITCEREEDGDCIITVTDTGIGMTREDIEHIFDRFYRSDNVKNQNISGHGLGLSLAKLIILSHTGKIKVRSQFKKGTSFIITLHNRTFW
mgnify:FL=1